MSSASKENRTNPKENKSVNSLPAKFDQVKDVVLKNVDILVITETELDDTFPLGQFYVEGGFTMPIYLPGIEMKEVF